MLKTVKQSIKKYGLIKPGDRILLGVSGGPDSLVLALVLNALKEELGLKLQIAHLDHGLRKDSGQDAVFVRKFAGRLGIPVTIAKTKIRKINGKGSIEEISRNARLAFFFSLAKKIKADKIALGHNLDDNAETVLMRLIRGAGLYGLSAISPKREINGFCLIRPLIEVGRAEIEAFLKTKEIKPLRDKTNSEDIYFRNKIRNQLLPLLQKYNPLIKENLSRTARIVADDYDYLKQEAQSTAKKLGQRIDIKKFCKLHPAIQRMILRLNIKRLCNSTRRINFQHISEIEDLIFNRPENSVVDLPNGLAVVKKKNKIYFFKQ